MQKLSWIKRRKRAKIMPRKVKDITRLLDKFDDGTATDWDRKNLGNQCSSFKDSDIYYFLKWEVDRIINSNLDASLGSGAIQKSWEFQSGYLAGVRAFLLCVEDRIKAMDDIYVRDRQQKDDKKEEEVIEDVDAFEPHPIFSTGNSLV